MQFREEFGKKEFGAWAILVGTLLGLAIFAVPIWHFLVWVAVHGVLGIIALFLIVALTIGGIYAARCIRWAFVYVFMADRPVEPFPAWEPPETEYLPQDAPVTTSKPSTSQEPSDSA
jgi:hypothetical protein